MRKEVKKAMQNVEAAVAILKQVSGGDTIPEKVRKKSSDVATELETAIDGMKSIINTYTN